MFSRVCQTANPEETNAKTVTVEITTRLFHCPCMDILLAEFTINMFLFIGSFFKRLLHHQPNQLVCSIISKFEAWFWGLSGAKKAFL